jgi:hypothetical protein
MINHTLKINYHAKYHYNTDVNSQTMRIKGGRQDVMERLLSSRCYGLLLSLIENAVV